MYRYIVQENKEVTPSVRLLTLVSKDPSTAPLLYRPGQYAAISLHDGARPTTTRCFSIISSPTQGNLLQFSVRVKGRYTSALERLEEGDEVAVSGPYGSFVFDEHQHHDVTFFAGGIGIAPLLSMIRYATDIHATNRMQLVYSSRSDADMPFVEELRRLMIKNPHLSITYIVEEQTTDQLDHGRVLMGWFDETTIEKTGVSYDGDAYMICGPPPYMQVVSSALVSHDVSREYIMTESFSQGSLNQRSPLMRWPLNAYALTGLLSLIAFGSVVGTDLDKTIPAFAEDDVASGEKSVAASSTESYTLSRLVREVGPQVSTDISQEPVITYIEDQTPPASTPAPAPKPVPVIVERSIQEVVPTPALEPEPEPQPTPTVVPKKPARSSTS